MEAHDDDEDDEGDAFPPAGRANPHPPSGASPSSTNVLVRTFFLSPPFAEAWAQMSLSSPPHTPPPPPPRYARCSYTHGPSLLFLLVFGYWVIILRPSSSSSFPPFCGKKQIGHLRLLSLREREATFSHVWKRGGGREGDADDFFPSSSSSILPSSRFPLSTLRYIPRRSPPILFPPLPRIAGNDRQI